MLQRIFIGFLIICSKVAIAQVDSADVIDYSKFGDAEGVKRYTTQKILNQLPQRIVSLGYEYHAGFDMPSVPISSMLPAMQNFRVNQVSSLRAQANIPVISTNKIIWQLGANYWGSKFNVDNPGTNLFAGNLDNRSMITSGINSTVFKPLNEKNFLIFQASADINGVFREFNDISSKAITVSGTAIYGWKTSEKNMIGAGISRTYRAGQILHVPVLFWSGLTILNHFLGYAA